ncbi:MAG: hypothetical protein RLY86_3076 [Pseudomonadota bacterium]
MDSLTPEMRRDLKAAFDRLSDLLDEETGRLPRADADELALYAEAKRALFEQLGILLREARTPPPPLVWVPPPLPGPDPAADSGAPVEANGSGEGGAIGGATDGREDGAVPPPAVQAAARRLRDRVEVNRRSILAAQDAVAAVGRQLGRALERQQTDGVYARHGTAPRRGQPGFGRVDHEL